MKKMTMALAAAALSVAAVTAHAATTVATNGNMSTPVPAAGFVLSTSYKVTAGIVAPNSTFTTTLDVSSSASRPIGYFTITGLQAGNTYKLGEVAASGADNQGVAGACFQLSAGNGSTPCAGANSFLIDASADGTVYVQVDHAATPASEGTTFVNIPVTAYSA